MRVIASTLCVVGMGLALASPLPEVGPNEVRAAVSCYKVSGESEKRPDGWAHIVVVENDCEHQLDCTVWTSKNPNPKKKLTVDPYTSERVEITSESTKRRFKALGSCRRT